MSGKYWLILCKSILCLQRCLKLQGKKRDQYSIVASQAFNSAAHVGVHGLPFLSDLACSISALALVCNIEHEHSKPKNYSNKQAKIKEAWGIEVSDDNVCLGPEILVKGSSSSPGISLKTLVWCEFFNRHSILLRILSALHIVLISLCGPCSDK